MWPWTVLILLFAGCGGGGDEAHPEKARPGAAAPAGESHAGEPGEPGEQHGEPGGPAGEAPHAAGEGEVAVSPEVLRDLKLTTAAAELRAGGEGVTALGELKVDEERYAEVGSPVDARVVRPLVAPGQSVRRGQPLVELESVVVGQARAERVAALARSGLARQTADRMRRLAADQVISKSELQQAEAGLAEAEAELRSAEASLDALGVGPGQAGRLSVLILSSPIAGTVLERRAVRGQNLSTEAPGEPLFRIGDLSRLWLVVQAPERDVVRLAAGAAAEITLAAVPGQKLRGTVEWIGREVDAHSRTVPVRIVLPNEGGRLRPGMFATARIATGAAGGGEPVVAVPARALQRMDDQWVVFLPREAGRFEARPVQRGRDLGNEVAVLAGLKPGDRVVVEGAFVLRAEAEKGEGGAEHHH
jgi:cobalt-zinc-cadmium efflux system membrane fusion protein